MANLKMEITRSSFQRENERFEQDDGDKMYECGKI